MDTSTGKLYEGDDAKDLEKKIGRARALTLTEAEMESFKEKTKRQRLKAVVDGQTGATPQQRRNARKAIRKMDQEHGIPTDEPPPPEPKDKKKRK